MVKSGFSALLLKWNREFNTRQMPWKGEKDPYRIWLSEIILQQTRVEQGIDYYNKFITKYPTIRDLANANDEIVFKDWEGLGYYSRCRNLLHTARYIVNNYNAEFPNDHDTIRSLKGIGPYTAAAISSFAFDLPYAVVDGNVYRVLSRFFGIDTPVDSTEGKKFFNDLAAKQLDKKEPGVFNQAIMDLGATVCKPVSPSCNDCIFRKKCAAFIEDKVNELPVKMKKISIKNRWFYYLVLEHKNRIALRKRTGKDIWQSLFEFPLIESDKELNERSILEYAKNTVGKNYKYVRISHTISQKLTHQKISSRFLELRLDKEPEESRNWKWVSREETSDYAFPRLIRDYLEM